MKSMNDDGPSFDLKNISETRFKNVARAYAWWVAKDSCSLTILKVSGVHLFLSAF